MKKLYITACRLSHLIRNLTKPTWNYLKQGYKANLFILYCKHFVVRHLQEFTAALKRESEEMSPIHGSRVRKLHQLTKGLHSLFPLDSSYSYSILISVSQTPNDLTAKTIESALNQTAPQLEILIGIKEDLLPILKQVLNPIYSTDPRLRFVVVIENAEVSIFNELAKEAAGNFIFPLKTGDWIRPDFLYRCEQFLRLTNPGPSVCLYTDEISVNSEGYPLPGRYWQKPASICFPFHFRDDIGHCLLIPRDKWLDAGGLCFDLMAQGLWELALRLNLKGCHFSHLPFPLYAHRGLFHHPIDNHEQFIQKIEAHTLKMGFKWKWQKGLLPYTLRAIPAFEKEVSIQVIIPYKNQKHLTLKAVQGAIKQKGVNVKITAVDNGSEDLSIAEEIRKLGGEVLLVNEPFNYSRLNNLAVKLTSIAKECEMLLFLNNDVELEMGALQEMLRWISQPGIGLVGCWLSYPNQLLQHGGVDIILNGPAHQVTWSHSEKMRESSKMNVSKTLRLTDAATAACALMKKSDFIEVGGFDEMWYPVAYSDTNLAVKVQKKGLRSFYSPYAKGIHFESVSREVENIEDVENSKWLHELFLSKRVSQTTNFEVDL